MFTHGQLHIALSRVTDGANLQMIVPDTEKVYKEGKIKNVGYSEVLFSVRQAQIQILRISNFKLGMTVSSGNV
jgi:hypothetical protein